MTVNEKNISVWTEVNGGAKPNRASLQNARSLNCNPIFLGSNNWSTASTSRENITHCQTVYFAGIDESAMLGIKLNIECTCPSIKSECIHALAIERKYNSTWSLYFHLFGLPVDSRLGELHSRAEAVADLMKRDADLRSVATRITENHFQSEHSNSYYETSAIYEAA